MKGGAVAATCVGGGEVGRDDGFRQGLSVPGESPTVSEYAGFRRDARGRASGSAADEEICKRVDA